ncbi:MAG: hypothetical protein ACI94Y_004112 [Maribacter sp.]|jgi:hypothetical protein
MDYKIVDLFNKSFQLVHPIIGIGYTSGETVDPIESIF